jgi:hypothetical protein
METIQEHRFTRIAGIKQVCKLQSLTIGLYEPI